MRTVQVLKGLVPVALFLGFCALVEAVGDYGMLPAVAALLAMGVLPASVIIDASHELTAWTAALSAALTVAVGLALGAWLAIPIVFVVMSLSSASLLALRLREAAAGKERWSDLPLSFGAAMAAAFAAVCAAWAGAWVSGPLTICLLGGLLVLRLQRGPGLGGAA